MKVAGKASAGTRFLRLAEGLSLSSGAHLVPVEIAYRTWGRLSPARDNAVLVCHALSGSADVDLWWPGLFGAGRTLDPARQFVIASNVLGSCYGSSGPLSSSPRGTPYGPGFPAIDVRDMVRAQACLLDHLGVERLQFALGGSLGGMQVLEWLASAPERVASAAVIAAPARHGAWPIALAKCQAEALRADPRFLGGHYSAEAPPLAGLGAARRIGMCSYRSRMGLEARFARRVARGRTDTPREFEVGAWLDHHARSFAARFDANAFLVLSAAMDAHDVAAGRESLSAVLRRIQAPTLAIGIESDLLYPAAEVELWAREVPSARYLAWDAAHGHDSFLIDVEALDSLLVAFQRETRAACPAR